jgi:RHS repeat-associated protein
MTDAGGNQIDTTITYRPFGATRSGSVPADKLFTGQRLDGTGLYYYNARYYDPTIGRFISADTVFQTIFDPQCFNRYSYCINNPFKYIDPDGHFFALVLLLVPACEWLIGVTICAGATVAVIDNYDEIHDWAQRVKNNDSLNPAYFISDDVTTVSPTARIDAYGRKTGYISGPPPSLEPKFPSGHDPKDIPPSKGFDPGSRGGYMILYISTGAVITFVTVSCVTGMIAKMDEEGFPEPPLNPRPKSFKVEPNGTIVYIY